MLKMTSLKTQIQKYIGNNLPFLNFIFRRNSLMCLEAIAVFVPKINTLSLDEVRELT